ncbi:MAG: hypothetical protein J1F23_02810 [Oscillospiraceae bacterium]|nr:hypothetical protein [Oscillospiraceae bacterium]
MLYLVLSTTLFAIIFLIIESVNEFLFQHNNLILKIISTVIILIMAFVNGFVQGKYGIPGQTLNYTYLIFAIIVIIGSILIHKIKRRKRNQNK